MSEEFLTANQKLKIQKYKDRIIKLELQKESICEEIEYIKMEINEVINSINLNIYNILGKDFFISDFIEVNKISKAREISLNIEDNKDIKYIDVDTDIEESEF